MYVESSAFYDVIFVRRDGERIQRVSAILENVHREVAVEKAKNYCYQSESGEGVMIVHHGTNTPAKNAEWWLN